MIRQTSAVRPSRYFVGAAVALFGGSLIVAAWLIVVRAQLWIAVPLILVSICALWYGLCRHPGMECEVGWAMDGARPLFFSTRRVGNALIDEIWTIERIWPVAEHFIFLQLRNNRGTRQPKALASDMMQAQAWRRFRVFVIRADHGLRASGAARRPREPAHA